MAGKQDRQRKRYVKPEVARVDLIADEIAMVTCKRSTTFTHSTPNAGTTKCNTTTCKLQANS